MILTAQGKYFSSVRGRSLVPIRTFVKTLVSLLDQNLGITSLRANKASSTRGNQ